MTQSLHKLERKIERTREKLQQAEAKAREQRKRYAERQVRAIGRLAVQAGLDTLDRDAQYGAFLAIAEKMHDQDQVGEWRRLASENSTDLREAASQALAVRFDTAPDDQTKADLRALGFSWNKFRQEWQGSAPLEKVESMLKHQSARVEVVR